MLPYRSYNTVTDKPREPQKSQCVFTGKCAEPIKEKQLKEGGRSLLQQHIRARSLQDLKWLKSLGPMNPQNWRVKALFWNRASTEIRIKTHQNWVNIQQRKIQIKCELVVVEKESGNLRNPIVTYLNQYWKTM